MVVVTKVWSNGGTRGWLGLSMTSLKWLAILVPIAFLALVQYFLHAFVEVLHEWPWVILLFGAVAVAVAAFSFAVFGVIERLERRVLEQSEEVSQRNRELAALLAVGQAGRSAVGLGGVLDAALEAVLAVTSAEAAEVWLVTEGGELELGRLRDTGADGISDRQHLTLGEALPRLAVQTGEPVVVHGLAADGRVAWPAAQELGFESLYALPLLRGARTVGVLAVAAREPEALAGAAERRLLEGIGEQVAIAIENARLHERVLDAAVLEERERISRELHDGLAQVLGYINTQTLAIRTLLDSGRVEAAGESLASMEEASRHVNDDVREAILGLRTASREGLVANLRAYLREFGLMGGAALRLEAAPQAERIRLPASTELQLVRIVQEALSNVRKHAAAKSAFVSLRVEGEQLSVDVTDDGRGFDPEHAIPSDWPRFGLQTMQERAKAIGGRFEVRSRPGEGTTVGVRLALDGSAEVGHARSAC
jgi:signal transduction histidine kinase